MAGDITTITSEMTEQWSDVWVQWQHTARIAAIVVTLAGATACKVKIKNRAGSQLTHGLSGDLSSGDAWYPNRALAKADLVRIAIRNSADTADYTGQVESITIYTFQHVAVTPALRLTYSGVGVPPWRYQIYDIGERAYLTGITCVASETLKARLFIDGATSATTTQSISTKIQTPLGTLAANAQQVSTVELDFVDTYDDAVNKDTSVSSVMIHAQEPEPVGENGIQITGHANYRNRLYKFPDRGAFAVAVIGVHAQVTNWTGTLTVTPDGVTGSTWTHTLTSAAVSRIVIPITRAKQIEGSIFAVDLNVTDGLPFELSLIPRRLVPVPGDVLEVYGTDSGIERWLYERYDFGRTVKIVSVKVESDAGVTDPIPIKINAWENGSLGTEHWLSIVSERERLASTFSSGGIDDPLRTVEFCFTDSNGNANYRVRKVTFWLEKEEPFGAGLHLLNPEHTQGLVLNSPSPVAMTAMQVDLESYPANSPTLKVYADGVLVDLGLTSNYLVNNNLIIPALTLARRWTFNLDPVNGTTLDAINVQAFHAWFRTGPARQVEGQLRLVATPGDAPPWLRHEYQFPPGTKLVSAIVISRHYPAPMNLYINGSATKHGESPTAIADYGEFLFHTDIRATDIRTLSFDFGGDDKYIDAVYLFPREVIEIGVGGLIIRDGSSRISWLGKILQFKDTGSFDGYRSALNVYTGTPTPTLTLTPKTGDAGNYPITDNNDVRIGSRLPNCKEWTFSVTRPAGTIIDELDLYGRREMALKNGVAIFSQEDDPVTSLIYTVRGDTIWNPACVRVLASSYASMTLSVYHESTLVIGPVSIANETFKYLPDVRRERVFQFSLNFPEGTLVHEFAVATSPDKM